MPVKKSKSLEKMPERKTPKGFEFSKNKKTIPNKPATRRPGTPVPLAPAPKREYSRGAAPAPMPQKPARTAEEKRTRRPAPPKTTKKAPGKMTPQDSAMKKILEKKYGKIYG